MRIALLAPLPPEQTGIADYAANLKAALEGVAPKALGKLNKGEAPGVSLILSSALASGLLLLNYSRGLVGAFTFLIMMTTVACLLAYMMCGLAELKHSRRSSLGWAAVAVVAALGVHPAQQAGQVGQHHRSRGCAPGIGQRRGEGDDQVHGEGLSRAVLISPAAQRAAQPLG